MANISEAGGTNERVSKSEDTEVENVAKKSDRDDLHKRKNVKMSCGVYDNRLLRAIKNDERRRSARYDRLSIKRLIPEDENSVLDDENSEDNCEESLIDLDKQVNPNDGNPEIPKENEENIFVCAEIKVESKDRGQEEVLETNVATNILDKDSFEDPKTVTCDTDGTLSSEELVETVTNKANNEDLIKESKPNELEGNIPNDCRRNINNSKIPVRIFQTISEVRNAKNVDNDPKLLTKDVDNDPKLPAKDVDNDPKLPNKRDKPPSKAPTKLPAKDVDNDPKLPNKRGKPPSKAPTNDRREKLQQYLAEKKKLNQAKRRIEKPAFKPTGKIKYDVGPVGAIRPNSYSVGANNRQNQGPFGSRSGSCISRSGSTMVRTGSNLSRKNSMVSRGGSTLSMSGSALSKNGSSFSKTNSNLARTHSTLSRSTLTMIR